MATTAWIGGGSSVKQRLPARTQLFRRDSNPLRRAVDRAEAVTMTALIAAFVIAWLALAVVGGRWADIQGLRQEHAERTAWHPVSATLTESAAQATDSSSQLGVAWVPASWQLPDGQWRSGRIATELNAQAGQKEQIWINAAGQQTRPPLTSAGVRDQVAFTLFSITMAVAVALAVAFGCVRLLFNRRRMAGWSQAWQAIGPTWSRQG